jgi:outer membrane protein assembly factor BamA/autotransporter translocation and assembly factor TamB
VTRTRRVLLVLAALAALVLVLLAFGFFPQEPVRRLAEARLRSALGPQARIGRLRVHPAGLRAEVSDLVLEAPSYRLEVPSGTLALGAGTLLGAGVSIRHLALERPRLVMRPADDNEPARPSDTPLVVHSLDVRDATIVYEAPQGRLTLGPLDVSGSVGAGALEARAEGGTWAGERSLALGPAHARLTVSPLLAVEIESLELGTARSRVRVEGALGRPGAIRPDLHVAGRLDLADVAELTDRHPLSGALSVEGRIDGADVTATGTATGLNVLGLTVDRVDARGTMGEAESEMHLQARLLGGRAEGEARLVGGRARGRVGLADVDLRHLARSLGEAPLLAGKGSGEVTFAGDPRGALRIEASVTATGNTAGGTSVDARAAASGSVVVEGPSVDLAWTLDTDVKGPSGGAPRLETARLSARGTARGALPPNVSGDVEGEAALVGPNGPIPVQLSGTIASRDGALTLGVDAHGGGGSAAVAAELRAGVFRQLTLRADSLDLAAMVPDAQGRLAIDLKASGPAARLTGAGEARVAGLVLRGMDLGDVAAILAAERGALRADLSVPTLNAAAVVRASQATSQATARVTLESTPLSPLTPVFPRKIPLEGSVSGVLDVALDLDDPRSLEARAHVTAAEARSGRFDAALARPLVVTIRDDRVHVEDLALTGAGATVEASGTLGLSATAPLDLRVSLDADLATLPLPETWVVAGELSADVTLSGSARRPLATGSLAGEGVTIDRPGLPSVRLSEARVALEGDVAVPTVSAASAGGTVRLTGRVPFAAVLKPMRRRPAALDDSESARVLVGWDDIDAAALVASIAPKRAAGLAARLSGSAELAGGFASLSELRGSVTMPAVQVAVQDAQVSLAPAVIRLESGRVTTDGIELTAEGGTLRIDGALDLEGRAVDATGRGRVDLRVLSPLLENASLTGAAEVDVAVGGTLDAPRPSGRVTMSGATLRMRELPQAISELGGVLVFDGRTVRLENVSAVLGGGTITASGTAALAGRELSDLQATITGRDIALRYPVGMRSSLEADLVLKGRPFVLSGTVRALRGVYDLDAALRDSMTATEVEEEASPLMQAIALDLRIVTENPVRVSSTSLARIEAMGSLSVRGDMDEPAPFGRLELVPGGKLPFQGREFEIDTGRLTYQGTWDPTLEIIATQTIEGEGSLGLRLPYDVTIEVRGTLETPALKLRSQPTLSETQIVSLIATGRVGGEALASTAWVAGEQAAAFLAGGLSRKFTETFRELGIDEVTIQPELLARETEPGARFTFRKQISRYASLIYSLSLTNTENRFIRLELEPGRDVLLHAQREDDGTLGVGAGQTIRWGGAGARRAAPPDRGIELAAVRFEGPSPIPEEEMRNAVDVTAGDRATSWEVQEGAERLREALIAEGRLEAEVGARIEGDAAVFVVRPGPLYRWRVEGMPDPPDLSREVRSALFEEEALENGRRKLLDVLRGRGHLEARVLTRAVREDDTLTLVFQAEPGPKLGRVEVRFPGASLLSEAELLEAAGGAAELLVSPQQARDRIEEAYRRRHHRLARVEPPRAERGEGRAVITVAIDEGPPARVAAVELSGASLPAEELAGIAGLEAGRPYDEADVAAAVQRIREHYLRRGYLSVRVRPEATAAGPDVAVKIVVDEGERVVVRAVEVRGLRTTHESVVRGRVRLRPGDAVNPRRLAAIERRLLEMGIFTRAAIIVGDDRPATITVEVEEQPRYRAGYDVRYDDDERGSASVNGEVGNLLGRGLSVGGRYEVGADVRDFRGLVTLPALWRGKLTASVFRLEDDLPPAPDLFTGELIVNTIVEEGFDLQQTLQLPNRWTLLNGYRFTRRFIDPSFPDPIDVATLDVSLLRETRDNPLDARRGRFLSATVELSPKTLGSDLTFVKGLAQAFVVRAVGESLTWAQGYRLGLAHGFGGQRLISSERFKAGGGDTVRGYRFESIGPVGPLGDPLGGQAVLILNQELRYMSTLGLGLVGFWDAGNVFESVRDFDFGLRHAVGAGLRWRSPVGLLRLDVGFPLSRRDEDDAYRVFFSIGQAF